MRPALPAPIVAAALALAAAPALAAADPPPVAPPVGAPPGTVDTRQASPATPPPRPAAPGTTVSPVTVFPNTDPPKLAKSFPAAGQAMPAGILVMSVTFDQPMLPTGFDFGPAAGGEAPHCLKTPRLLDDKRTFVLLCTTEPSKAYALSFNAEPQAGQGQGGFQNVAQHRAAPASLAFRTTGADGPKDIHEAMKAAGLRDNLDMPIEVSPDRHGDMPEPVSKPPAP